MYPDVQVCMNGITSAYLKMKSAYLIAIYMNMYPDSQVCNNEIGSPVQSRVAEIFLQSDPDMHVNIEDMELDPVSVWAHCWKHLCNLQLFSLQ